MKIEGLNDKLSEARVTRGFWRKRYTIVKCSNPDNNAYQSYWAHEDGSCIDNDVWYYLKRAIKQEEHRRRERSLWHPVTKLPKAQVIKCSI